MGLIKRIAILLKIVVVVLSFAFVFYKIERQGFSEAIASFSEELILETWPFFLFSLLLMFVGWSIEAFKWMFAMNGLVRIKFSDAIKTVWYGVSVGIVTPNRAGEPFGRLVFVEKKLWPSAGVMSVLCSIGQQLSTLFFGAVGASLLFLFYNFSFDRSIQNPLVYFFLFLSFLIPLLIFLKLSWVIKLLIKLKPIQKLNLDETLLNKISKRKLLLIFTLSLFRYVVFSTQFLFLLQFFGYNLTLTPAYLAIFLTYLFASAIPSYAFGEPGVRSSFAILFIGTFWNNAAGITFAATSLWIINVAIPGLIGVWLPFVSGKKSIKQNYAE